MNTSHGASHHKERRFDQLRREVRSTAVPHHEERHERPPGPEPAQNENREPAEHAQAPDVSIWFLVEVHILHFENETQRDCEGDDGVEGLEDLEAAEHDDLSVDIQ